MTHLRDSGSDDVVRVVVIAGSLREASYNRRLARLAVELAPAGAVLELFDALGEVEPFDADLEAAVGVPPGAARFTAALRAADAVLVVTPEYNGSIPGQLKNAFDWASRAAQAPHDRLDRSAMYGRPVAVASASTGQFGAVWAQDELRKVLRTQGARVVDGPKVAIGGAREAFGASGQLLHEPSRRRLRELLEQLADTARSVRVALDAASA